MAIIQESTEYNKKLYEQANPIPAKFLHSDGSVDENVGTGGTGTSLKYRLYGWDYMNGICKGYTEKEVPEVGDLLFLKLYMEEGGITDTTELEWVFHIISANDGTIVAVQHPEEIVGGYTFTRSPDDDYEEKITDVRDIVDITHNGFITSQKGTVFKNLNVKVQNSGGYILINQVDESGFPYYFPQWTSLVIEKGTYRYDYWYVFGDDDTTFEDYIDLICSSDKSKYSFLENDVIIFNEDITPNNQAVFSPDAIYIISLKKLD